MLSGEKVGQEHDSEPRDQQNHNPQGTAAGAAKRIDALYRLPSACFAELTLGAHDVLQSQTPGQLSAPAEDGECPFHQGSYREGHGSKIRLDARPWWPGRAPTQSSDPMNEALPVESAGGSHPPQGLVLPKARRPRAGPPSPTARLTAA